MPNHTPVSLLFKPATYHFPCHTEIILCLLGKESDLFYADLVPPPSHLSHLILEQYQDSDLPLTSTEGMDTKRNTPLHHSVAINGAMPNNSISPQPKARTATMSRINQLSAHLKIFSLVHPCTHVSACIMNWFRYVHSSYSEDIAIPNTLSSFLQLSTDQLMTTNETLRDIHAGILEWCWEKAECRERDNKLWTASHSKINTREVLL